MAIKRILKINYSWTELFNFLNSFNCHRLELLRTAPLPILKTHNNHHILRWYEWGLLVFCKQKLFQLAAIVTLKGMRYTICKMTAKRAAANSMEINAYIEARSLLGLKPVEIHCDVCDIYGGGQMSHRSVCRWEAKFKAGQQDLKDSARSGRPPTTTATKSNIKKITDLLNQNARYTVRALARLANFSLARVHGILRKHLKLRKINARWRPLLLTD